MTPYAEKFVLHIGEMGSRWGLNRTLGQMCGLLFVSSKPLNADEITEALNISRSNVSMGLKELKAWRLVQPATVTGDRREYWTTSKDVWELFRTLAEERRRREIDPTLTMLRETLMTDAQSDDDRYAQERLQEMHDLIEMLNNWVDDMNSLPPKTLIRFLKLGRKVQKFLDPRRKKKTLVE
jgi:DNA-binding transcriptional regulator GbsR (MarR family)